MARRIVGPLKHPGGEPMPGALIRFTAAQTSLPGVPHGAATVIRTDAAGNYDVTLESGIYQVSITHAGRNIGSGNAVVTDGPDVTLPEIMQAVTVPQSLALDLLARVTALEQSPPGGIAQIQPGAGIGVDNTTPALPVVSVSGPIDAGVFT